MLWLNERERVYNKWRPIWFQMLPHDIAEYSWNYLFTGGKQIRPTLFCELWNYLEPGSQINYDIAFAIECIHAASLILDDSPWMDNASERRGRPTLHIVYSPKKALLITHDLIHLIQQIWATSCPSHIDSKRWMQLLKDKIYRLIIGQQYDLDKVRVDLYTLASLKTGVLFELVAETAATCLQLDPIFWRTWGNNIGALFQWVDDWLDRDEDHKQSNRNAFNENGADMPAIYYSIWNIIIRQIGPQWLHSEMGKWMHQYFTTIPPPIESRTYDVQYPILSEVTMKLPTGIHNVTGKDLLSYIWHYMNKDTHYEPSKLGDLWSVDENTWDKMLDTTKWI